GSDRGLARSRVRAPWRCGRDKNSGTSMSHARYASTSAPEAWWNDETLRDWIERHERERPQHTALLGTGSSLSYSELNGRVRALAQVLRSLGLRRGDVIAAQLPNIPEFVLTYLAAGYVGAVLQRCTCPIAEPRSNRFCATAGHARSFA